MVNENRLSIMLFKSTLFPTAIAVVALCPSAVGFSPTPLHRTSSLHRYRSPALNQQTPVSSKTQTATNTNVNFDDWIADAPHEITEWKDCPVEGTIPSYVDGTLIRNGGGIWSVSGADGEESVPYGRGPWKTKSEDEMFSHIFDGLAKIHAYRIHGSKVEHQARFLKGKWYNEYMKTQQLPAGIGTGPVLDANEQPKTGLARTLQAVFNSATIFDNTPVNIWDWTPKTKDSTSKRVTALTDAPPRTTIDFDTMDTVGSTTMNSFAKDAQGYELFITAHPMYSQTESSSSSSVDTYNVAVEIGLGGPRINLIKETSEGERSVVTSFASDDGKLPYMHSFGLSKNYATIVLQPLRLNPSPDLQVEKGFLRSMDHVDQTRIVLVELATGDIVLDKSIDDKVYFYHTISQAETSLNDKGDVSVSLRLCAYENSDQLTGEHQFMRLEQARKGRDERNKMTAQAKFCDIICNTMDGGSVHVEWNDRIDQFFELPITRYSRTFNGELPKTMFSQEQQAHPRYVYAFGAFALGATDYDNWGLFKFDLEQDTIESCYQQDSVYLSEPLFVADPDGTSEDDGVLLSQAYFGREQETKLLVIDAKTMEMMAEIPTGNRAPLDFHGAWIPSL